MNPPNPALPSRQPPRPPFRSFRRARFVVLVVATGMVRTAILCFFAFGGFALAEADDSPLPKGDIPLAKVAATCQGALVATLVSIDYSQPTFPGAGDYQAHWKVIKTLRGKYPRVAELSFRVQGLPGKYHERTPQIGHTYILVTYDTSPTQIDCIFENTPEKLDEIKALLNAKSK